MYHFCNGGESAYGNGTEGNDANVFYDNSNQENLDKYGLPIDKKGGVNSLGGMVTCMGIQPSTLAWNLEGGGLPGVC